MITTVFSAALRGVDALEVEIEVNSGRGDPQIGIFTPISRIMGNASDWMRDHSPN